MGLTGAAKQIENGNTGKTETDKEQGADKKNGRHRRTREHTEKDTEAPKGWTNPEQIRADEDRNKYRTHREDESRKANTATYNAPGYRDKQSHSRPSAQHTPLIIRSKNDFLTAFVKK